MLWKLASVVPVHKKGSQSVTKNNRPISLLPSLSKVMKAIVNRSLMDFLERNHILSTNQYGFRRALGIHDLLTLLHHRWSTVSAQGVAASVVPVDKAGAFDEVSHQGVLYKAQQYGVSGMLLHWLIDYLVDQSITVVVRGQISFPHGITAGIPQGSLLGPTVFLLYINDAEDHLSQGVDLAVYADDTALFQCLNAMENIDNSSAVFLNAVDSLKAWGSRWRIAFEPSKSQAMTIDLHRQPWHSHL